MAKLIFLGCTTGGSAGCFFPVSVAPETLLLSTRWAGTGGGEVALLLLVADEEEEGAYAESGVRDV